MTIVADSDDHTVRFREHLNKSNYIRLLSCPLYNLLRNLPEEEGDISIFDRQKSASISIIPSDKYTHESLAKALGKISSEGRGLKVTVNNSKTAMFSSLLGIDQH